VDRLDIWGIRVLPILLIGALLLLGGGLGYFIFLGVRAIYRGASHTARDAGHAHRSAGRRAALRMTVWAAFFGIFYSFLYFLGRRMGWWALVPGLLGGIAMIFSLLQADRLLTIHRGEAWQQFSIGLTIVVVLATMASVTWFAAATS
jgi:hypothetical protein